MATRIDIGEPEQYARVASEILQAAWKPPSLHYSAEYLAWQFGFPGDIPKRAAIAILDDRPVGCIAVTVRRFACGEDRFSAYVLSFVAVHPSASRRGLGAAMYAALLDALPRDIPVFAFAEPDSIGERLLLDSFSRAGFLHHPLRACRAAGFLRRPGGTQMSGALAQETTSYEAFASAGVPDQTHIAWTDVAPQYWDHYRHDPRERLMLTVRDETGTTVGTAMLVSAELISAQGLLKVPMLESVALNRPTPDALAALLTFAASRSQPGSTVIASNLSFVDEAVVRAAGTRALPSLFNAHAFIRGHDTILENVDALNLEVT